MIQDAHRSDLQNYIWDIMKVILKFIEKEGTEYYMLGGALLGAVRHKGFIPWDDDIDIGIPRGEYERFLSDIKRELPDYMAVRTYKNSRNHHYYFSRIVDKRYKVKRTGSEVDRLEEVWVDIFRWTECRIDLLNVRFTKPNFWLRGHCTTLPLSTRSI